jgi:hypothetical protein
VVYVSLTAPYQGSSSAPRGPSHHSAPTYSWRLPLLGRCAPTAVGGDVFALRKGVSGGGGARGLDAGLMVASTKLRPPPPPHFLLQLLNFPLNGGSEVVVMPWSKSSVMRPISDLVGSLSVYVLCAGGCRPHRALMAGICRRFFAAAFLDSLRNMNWQLPTPHFFS